MQNGERSAMMPAMDDNAQTLAGVVAAVDRLTIAIEELLKQASNVRGDIQGNQSILRIINGEVGDLATAIRLTLDRLPGPGTPAPRAELAELAARIRAAREQEAVLAAYVIGAAYTTPGDVRRRIQELSHMHLAIVAEFARLAEVWLGKLGEEISTENPDSP